MSTPCMSRAPAAGSRMPPDVATRLDTGASTAGSYSLPTTQEERCAVPLRIASSTLSQLGALFRQFVIELESRDLTTADRHRLKLLADLGAHVADDAANLADYPRDASTRHRAQVPMTATGDVR
ncbi:hypothetical protein [Bordetella genomosp. 13]|uniref:hypothetical protein n=1 Tax=Bordetella genomosp. 13 TaxID=463040 RepID=UPI0011A8DBA6|nr:hypothetical protein [Bordetella genomosp. 13]